MSPQPVTVVAGVFLGAFGGAGAIFLARRFPAARFLRAGYILMSAGGVLFAAWGVSRTLAVGVAGATLVAVGAAAGTIGALRKELRLPNP